MIKVQDLSFSYSKAPFMKDINFEVKEGEILGFLGPSGAGKSTLQKILIGMIPSYQGSASINGMECKKANKKFYKEIGVDFEYPTLYEKLSGMENLKFFRSLYQKECRDLYELFQAVGLERDKDKLVSAYSKGMKSRLNFIKALIHNPSILFLDEPTSGLDPTSSRIMKQLILEEKKKGTTIIITTHNMQDATELCDQVAFIVDGRIKALDTPHNLIMKKGATRLVYTYQQDGERLGECSIHESSSDALLQRLIATNRLTSIHSTEPNLNDIFIEVTGRTLL